MRTIEEILNAEGLIGDDGNPVMTVEYCSFLCRLLDGKMRVEDAPMLALVYGIKLKGLG